MPDVTLTTLVGYYCYRADSFQTPLDPDKRRDYDWVHNKSSGDSLDGGTTRHILGQHWSPPGSYFRVTIRRGVICFTGTIPTGVIGKARLKLLGYQNLGIDTDFSLTIVDGDISDLGLPAYGELHDHITSFGSIFTTSWQPTGWNTIELNSFGLSYLDTHRTNPKLGMRSSLDITATPPNIDGAEDKQQVDYYHSSAILYVVVEPYLELRSLTETRASLWIQPQISPRRIVDIDDKVTLETIRNIEMAARGRFYIDEEGKAKYKSRIARQL